MSSLHGLCFWESSRNYRTYRLSGNRSLVCCVLKSHGVWRRGEWPVRVETSKMRCAVAGAVSRRSTEDVVAELEKFDLVIIGCGPAGEKGGAQAAYFGKRVAVVERATVVGGSCINTGTVPSKTLRESALYFSGLKQRGLYGIDYSLKENLTIHDFMHHEREVVEMERSRILRNLELHKIEFIRGQGAFEDPHTVSVKGPSSTRTLRGEIILIATGSKPHRPPEVAFDDIHTFDSDTFLQMDRIPKTLAVIGG